MRTTRSFIRPPKTIVREDPMFYCCFFIFVSTRNLQGPSADLREILAHTQKHVKFYNPGPKIWGPAPPP